MQKRFAACALAWLLCVFTPGVPAQDAPRRLSQWLAERGLPENAFLLGLIWQVPEEKAAQSLLKHWLLADPEPRADPISLARLRDWLQTLPVTGRVPIGNPDARWLEVHPERDPVILPSHNVVVPARPRTLTVVLESGERCTVEHSGGREAMDYVQACHGGKARGVDWAWIAQPDGRVQRFGVAPWNVQPQDLPAPGAWLWAPARGAGFSERFSEHLVRFLATQGPALDSGEPAMRLQPTASSVFSLRSPYVHHVTASDWGTIGLLQTPTARTGKAGAFSFGASHVWPYTRYNIIAQPFDWMETGFRYTDIANRLYGPAAFSGNQTQKDKAFDLRLRLWRESAYVPELAVGFRDLAGTGLFSGEYVVGNKRFGPVDLSLGMGWGYVGGRGDIRNPLSRVLGSSFDTRGGANQGLGGRFSVENYFHGSAAFFGGLQYQTPWQPVVLKLEYDGNNYQNEPAANPQKQTTPINFGLTWRMARWADLSIGVERGNRLQLGLNLHTDLGELYTTKFNDAPRVPLTVERPRAAPDWTATSAEIRRQTGWSVDRIETQGRDLRVTMLNAGGTFVAERLDKATAVLNRDAPAQVDRFTVVYRQGGLEVAEHVIDRNAWLARQIQQLPPHLQRETVVVREPEPKPHAPREQAYAAQRERLQASLGLDWQHVIGGPDAFVLYQLSAAERFRFWFSDSTWVRGKFRYALVNNFEEFKAGPGDSALPNVRTFLREYFTSSELTLANMQFTHVGKLTNNQFYSIYAGYFEEMFGGVGTEWLYRPFQSRTAFGVDLNYAKQRNFQQNFAFRDYDVITGHGTLYYDTGWNDVLATIKAGRYLAGDLGFTLDLSRTFRNGVVIGAFATKTNVSPARFGEGSFDKGVYLVFPFDTILTRSSGSVGSFVWRPITRDGGAIMGRQDALYGITGIRSDRALWLQPADKPNDTVIPVDRRETWEPARAAAEPYARVPAKPVTLQPAAQARFEDEIARALTQQRFQNIDVSYDGSKRLVLRVEHKDLRPAARAVGRAARTALAHAPMDAREIRITLMDGAAPVATYEFIDLARLDRYFRGALPAVALHDYVAVRYADESARPADPLAGLDDLRSDESWRTLPSMVAESPPVRAVERAVGDTVATVKSAGEVDWFRAAALGTGLIAGSALLDKPVFRFSERHADSRWLRGATTIGNALPWIGLGAAGVVALEGSDPVRSRTGFAAVEAGATAFVAATGLKYGLGRARPDAGEGHTSFHGFSTEDRYNAFPSRHAAVAWALATPFAKEYDVAWPYVAAGAVTFARAGSREHWLSDSVAGSLLGYGLGHLFWQASRERHKDAPRVMLNPSGITLGWNIQ